MIIWMRSKLSGSVIAIILTILRRYSLIFISVDCRVWTLLALCFGAYMSGCRHVATSYIWWLVGLVAFYALYFLPAAWGFAGRCLKAVSLFTNKLSVWPPACPSVWNLCLTCVFKPFSQKLGTLCHSENLHEFHESYADQINSRPRYPDCMYLDNIISLFVVKC